MISKKRIGIRRSDGRKNDIVLLMMCLPAILYVFVFSYLPLPGLVIAFKDINYSKGILESDWIGLRNFKFLFQSPDTFIIIRNTVLYGLVGLITTPLFGSVSAMLLNELRNKRGAKIYQSIMFLPFFLSMVVVSYVAYAILNGQYGMLNKILEHFGFEGKDWYMFRPIWPFIIFFTGLWKGLGYHTVVYLATISGIDEALYEAAVIDGASRWQQAKYITIPHLRTILTIMIIMSVGSILNSDFGLFYQLPRDQGALYPVTQVIDTYVYRALQVTGDLGMSSAAGTLKSVVGTILVLLTNWIVTKVDPDSAMF